MILVLLYTATVHHLHKALEKPSFHFISFLLFHVILHATELIGIVKSDPSLQITPTSAPKSPKSVNDTMLSTLGFLDP